MITVLIVDLRSMAMFPIAWHELGTCRATAKSRVSCAERNPIGLHSRKRTRRAKALFQWIWSLLQLQWHTDWPKRSGGIAYAKAGQAQQPSHCSSDLEPLNLLVPSRLYSLPLSTSNSAAKTLHRQVRRHAARQRHISFSGLCSRYQLISTLCTIFFLLFQLPSLALFFLSRHSLFRDPFFISHFRLHFPTDI